MGRTKTVARKRPITRRIWKAKDIGKTLKWDTRVSLPTVRYPKGMRRDVFSRLRLADKLKADNVFNRIYRAAHGQQDELFSTALTREFLEGFLEKNNITANADGIKFMNDLVDIASSARIPTEFSGFATSSEVMQHPSNRAASLFADPYVTASEHSRLDTERRTYAESVMQKMIDGGEKDIAKVLVEGVKAAIRFTLNNFTAPVTAKNVQPFTRVSGKAVTDSKLQSQLASRERMKIRYVELGGTLRNLDAPETQMESITREWKFGMLEAPPSPRRSPIGNGIID